MRLKIHHIRMLSSISPIATAPSADSDTKLQARTTATAKDEKNKKTGKTRLDSSSGGCNDNDKETRPDPPAACCPICQEPVGQPTAEGIVEAWAALPCGHRYGHHCIKTWLGMADQPSCPICRTPMVHLCRHPVLPVLVVVAPRWLVLLGGGSSRLYTGFNISSRSDGGGGIVLLENTKNWRWRGRDLKGMCGFCAVSRRRWPLRVVVVVGRFVLAGLDPRRLRGRRVATAIELEQAQQQQPHGQEGAQGIQPIFYADHEDPWGAAFGAWWAQQEPRTTEPAATAEGGGADAGGVLIL